MIAAALGVSAATVSNALSGKGRVSPATARKIRAKAAEIGYVPSPTGRALRTGRTGVLGLVLPDIANPLFPQIAQAIENAASKAGYGVLIADSRDEIAAQNQSIERLIERAVDGLIVVPRRGTRIGNIACPVAMIDSPSTPGNTVAADHWAGGYDIGRHLAGIGHAHVLIIANSEASIVQNDRVAGIKAGLGAARAEVLWVERAEAAQRAGCGLDLATKTRDGVTAFATVSDLLALRALTELQRAGIGVPDAVSVTGFDDLVWAPVVSPALTTMRMDMATIAEIAVSALAEAITGQASPLSALPGRGAPNTVTAAISRVPMQLVVRQSSGPVASARTNLKQGDIRQ